jgi:hydroxymethylbilane synthase
MRTIRIGTRGSKLALWQAHTVADLISKAAGRACEIEVIRTSGDEGSGPPDPPRPSGAPPSGSSVRSAENVKRMFVKEIEEALLDRRIDVAVHSAKDLPGELPDGLIIAATLQREDPRDAILLPAPAAAATFAAVTAKLGPAPRLGTSSVRRVAQLLARFPGATFTPIRGNVDTRLRKLDAGECDAIVLAAAGVKRLGLENRLTALVPIDICVPAPGQGIVAVEIARSADAQIADAVRCISDADSEAALAAERAVVTALGGGCQMPLGALATLDGATLNLEGVVSSLDGRTMLRASVRGNRGAAASAGDKLAQRLKALGADQLLRSVHAPPD